MNANSSAACPACIIPRVMSCAGTNGIDVRRNPAFGAPLCTTGALASSALATDEAAEVDETRASRGGRCAFSLFARMMCALRLSISLGDGNRTISAHCLRQCASMSPRHAATQRLMMPSKNRPMQVPTIAPADAGTQPWNHSTSPGVKCRYVSMLPVARSL